VELRVRDIKASGMRRDSSWEIYYTNRGEFAVQYIILEVVAKNESWRLTIPPIDDPTK
jgi:hypothetical protein